MTERKSIEEKEVKQRSRLNGEDEEVDRQRVTRFLLEPQLDDEEYFTKVRGLPSVVSYLFAVPLLPFDEDNLSLFAILESKEGRSKEGQEN